MMSLLWSGNNPDGVLAAYPKNKKYMHTQLYVAPSEPPAVTQQLLLFPRPVLRLI